MHDLTPDEHKHLFSIELDGEPARVGDYVRLTDEGRRYYAEGKDVAETYDESTSYADMHDPRIYAFYHDVEVLFAEKDSFANKWSVQIGYPGDDPNVVRSAWLPMNGVVVVGNIEQREREAIASIMSVLR